MVRCCNHRFQLLGAETSGNGALDEADAKGGASLLMGAREGTGVMLNHLMPPNGRGRSAKTVEAFGWLVLVEGVLTLFAPRFIASVLHLPPLVDQAASYFRLVGLLACGVGMLYIVSGRLNAEGFVVASLLDRPLVPPAMAALWASSRGHWLCYSRSRISAAFSGPLPRGARSCGIGRRRVDSGEPRRPDPRSTWPLLDNSVTR
jgi:uncharacterized protein YjeT (DUF2065 family)